MQRHLRTSSLRSSVEFMFYKPKTMFQVGGCILDLSSEEKLAGQSIHTLDIGDE